MRLWSIHPEYLDRAGLVALWREGLLAKKVLENKTKGYRNHPQLNRFKAHTKSLDCINLYLHYVCDEADLRGYNFNRSKLTARVNLSEKMTVTSGQVEYEWHHLLNKLEQRDEERFLLCSQVVTPAVHPLFSSVPGDVESWEVVPK